MDNISLVFFDKILLLSFHHREYVQSDTLPGRYGNCPYVRLIQVDRNANVASFAQTEFVSP